jgi:hypothetical protein
MWRHVIKIIKHVLEDSWRWVQIALSSYRQNRTEDKEFRRDLAKLAYLMQTSSRIYLVLLIPYSHNLSTTKYNFATGLAIWASKKMERRSNLTDHHKSWCENYSQAHPILAHFNFLQPLPLSSSPSLFLPLHGRRIDLWVHRQWRHFLRDLKLCVVTGVRNFH